MEGALAALALLACPVGMGAMMWFMGRKGKQAEPQLPPSASVEELREEQQPIAAELDRPEGGHERTGQLARS